MPLPPAAARESVHTRQIECRGYRRADGLWDIEARLVDTKAAPLPLRERGLLPPGAPLHDLWLRITVDAELCIHEACSASDHTPFASCTAVEGAYARLRGLRIAPGWDREVRARVGGVAGCTHLTELLRPLATAAIQTVRFSAPPATPAGDGPEPGVPQRLPETLLDSCHSYDRRGETVRRHWPALYEAD